jgi:hypothetical protein
MEATMHRRFFTPTLVLLAACVPNPSPGTIAPSEAVREDRLDVPASLEVSWVGQDIVGWGGRGSSTFRSFFNVYGRHRSTGQRYLLVYERTSDGSKLVNIVTIADGLDERLLRRADTT